MTDDASQIKEEAAQAQARAQRRRGPAPDRQRPSESLHDDGNKRLYQDNDSGHIAIDLHGFDLTEEATEWRRYSNLSAPDPLPGYAQRWIRVRLAHKNDPTNVHKKFREGWRPRPVATLPKGHSLPTVQLGQFGECIGVEDMILCQMPLKVFNQMRKFYRDRRQQQTAATERQLEDLGTTHQVPIHKRKVTKVSRRAPVAADD